MPSEKQQKRKDVEALGIRQRRAEARVAQREIESPSPCSYPASKERAGGSKVLEKEKN